MFDAYMFSVSISPIPSINIRPGSPREGKNGRGGARGGARGAMPTLKMEFALSKSLAKMHFFKILV